MKKSKKLLQEENALLKAKLLVREHEGRYLHVPFSWGFLGRCSAVIISVSLAVLNFLLIIATWKMLALEGLDELDITGFHQLLILYPICGEYVLIALSVICLTALCKGGYSKLKKYDEEGLVGGLIGGLVGGLIVGLVGGLIGGLVGGLIVGLVGGLIVGLIGGLIGGLILGLILGLIDGLILGLIVGLIGGLIGGLILGLIVGLIDES